MKKILIVGGYGNFGKRIAQGLILQQERNDVPQDPVHIIIAGRNKAKADIAVEELSKLAAKDSSRRKCLISSVVLDVNLSTSKIAEQMDCHKPFVTIHTAGPFQGQDYRVPEACIAAKSHYVDLADDRRFVCDITSLNTKATAAGVCIVSGASSVPGLSSTVIEHFLPSSFSPDIVKHDTNASPAEVPFFSSLESIDMGISVGTKADIGEATLRGLLGYAGHPFKVFENNGQWVTTYGWSRPRRVNFSCLSSNTPPPQRFEHLGHRWVADFNIPDLELFPQRYTASGPNHSATSLKQVKFQAGPELPLLQFTMVGLSKLVQSSFIPFIWNLAPLTKFLLHGSRFFRPFGTDVGGMFVRLDGRDHKDPRKTRTVLWTLYAPNAHGPYIPTMPAIIVARKMLMSVKKNCFIPGARPCLGMYSLDEFAKEAAQWNISQCFQTTVTEIGG